MQDSRREGTGPERADVISAEPRALAFRPAWGLVAALLVAALAAALVVTLHYRGEAAAARRQLQSVTGPAPAGPAPAGAAPAGMASLRLSTSTAGLLAAPPLSGEVTVFAVRSSSGLARVVVTARITGGQPDARYELLGGDCAGDSSRPQLGGGHHGRSGVGRADRGSLDGAGQPPLLPGAQLTGIRSSRPCGARVLRAGSWPVPGAGRGRTLHPLDWPREKCPRPSPGQRTAAWRAARGWP